MATTPKKDPNKIERRDFLKKTGAVAGVIAAGFPGIISGQTVTNAVKVGLVGCGGRGSGAAGQALTADPHNELSALADIDDEIVERAATRLKGSTRFGERVKIDHTFSGLDAYHKVINSGVDVVLLATPPGIPSAAPARRSNANKHVFCEKPAATDSPGVRSVLETQKLAQTKNLSLVAGFCWRYNNMIQEAFDQMRNGAIGRLVAHYSTYYTNPVKPMPPESARPAGMSDVEWQIRNWYNFTWLCGDSLVEQAVHNVDKIMWIDEGPAADRARRGGRAAVAGQRRQHLRSLRRELPVPEQLPRRSSPTARSTGCYNGTLDYVMGTKAVAARRRAAAHRRADGQIKWQFQGDEYDMYQQEHDVLFASIRYGKPKNDDLNLATSTLLAIMGRMPPTRVSRSRGTRR